MGGAWSQGPADLNGVSPILNGLDSCRMPLSPWLPATGSVPPHETHGIDSDDDCRYIYRPTEPVQEQRAYSLSTLPKKRKRSCQRFSDAAFFSLVWGHLPPPYRTSSPRLFPPRGSLNSAFRACHASASQYPHGRFEGTLKLPATSGLVTLNSRAWT